MKTRILILGQAGYLGRALTQYLISKDYEVLGIDNDLRDTNVKSIGSDSLVPLEDLDYITEDVCDFDDFKDIVKDFKPQNIVHFAEQPSAPFSMRSQADAVNTQRNNILGSLNLLWVVREVDPKIHIIKLGTMGVYGTPEEDIPETNDPIAYDPASFYHISKAADSINLRKACQWWGLNATDIHQGVVYGYVPGTRFDIDYYFGTVINRFLAQALIGFPLTVYGKGGQTRGFLHVLDSMQCIELIIKNPASGYRVVNQFSEYYSVAQIALWVKEITNATIKSVSNPRFEKEIHTYSPKHSRLLNMGFKPRNLQEEIMNSWKAIQPYKNRVNEKVIMPSDAATWRRS